MARSTCDGDAYIHNLAVFIGTHERQLANALVAYKKLSRKQRQPQQQQQLQQQQLQHEKDKLSPLDTQETSYDDSLTPEIAKPVRLSLSLHHLYFILERFQELGINIGPMDIRLNNIDSESSNNYVSFLSEFSHSKKIQSDAQSIHSMSSVKSVMSSVSALWNTLSLATAKSENITSDLKYLNSAFTKLPCLRLANEPNAKLIEGHEEYPFETATPVKIFKSIVILEICDLDPKEIYGWDFLSEKLRHLTIKNSTLIDPVEVLVELVKSDLSIRGGSASATPIATTANVDDNNNNNNNNDTNNIASTNHINTNITKSEASSPGETFASLDPTIHLQSSATASSSTMLSNNGKKSPSLNSQSSYQQHFNHHNYQVGYHHSYQTPVLHNYQSGTHYPSSHHNYHSGYHHTTHNHSLGYDNNSTQSLISSSPSTYHNRGSTYSGMDEVPILSSARRSHYYYKPKGRRSRGSNNVNSEWNDDEFETHSSGTGTNLDSMSMRSNLNSLLAPPVTSETVTSPSVTPVVSSSGDASGAGSVNRIVTNEPSSKGVETVEAWKPLKKLSFIDTKIERISSNAFDQLGGLLSLDLSNNNLTLIADIPLAKLVNLRNLNLSYNKLFSTRILPKGLNKLTNLNLRGNKINDLNSLDNLKSLENIDLRNNRISNIKDLKPLFIINKSSGKVLIKNLLLLGNPISNYRGNRIEIFNLFNGVDINNVLKIDGSKPGIIEARMLLDEKTAKMKFKNFIDESIISKMTASVSNMNLNSFVKMTTTTTTTPRQSFIVPKSNDMTQRDLQPIEILTTNINITNTQSDEKVINTPSKPKFSFNAGSITPESKDSTQLNKTPTSTSTTVTSRGVTVSSNGILPPQFSNGAMNSSEDLRTLTSTANNVNIGVTSGGSLTNSNAVSRRASQETTHTIGGGNGGNGSLLRGIQLGTPALPIITQATTSVGATITTAIASTETSSSISKRVGSSLPSTKSSRSIHSIIAKTDDKEEEKPSGTGFSSGLKISVT